MKTLVIMVSGGIDSYIAWQMARNDFGTLYADILPIFVNLGQPYAAKELEICNNLYGEELVYVNADLVQLKNLLGTEEVTGLKPEIYGRNTLIAFYGALHGDEVWICALETEMTKFTVRDKQPEFFHLCSALFSFVFRGRSKEVVVRTPFADFSKTQLIEIALASNFVTVDDLKGTVSCYDAKEKFCGTCVTCFKRWIAMSNNGIEEDYVKHPYFANEYGRDTVQQMAKEFCTQIYSGKYTAKRVEETDRALTRIGVLFSNMR